MLHQLVRRPLFSAGATLLVLGATGAAYLGTAEQAGPGTAQAAFTTQVRPLTGEQAASADAQAAADAADTASIEALRDRGAAADEARELAARQAAAAKALAAEQAAAEKAAAAEQAAAEKAAAAEQAAAQARADRSRDAARERASRDARRDPRATGRLLAGEKGWGEDQFSCLDRLWTKESGWQHDADNPTSSAYGIPQALPGSKMSSFGADWETNPVTQIRWGLDYIDRVYGTPCSAWQHSQSNNWY